MQRPTLEKTFIKTDGGTIPVKVYREYRRNVRFSLGKRGAIMRMPVNLPAELQQKEWDRFRNWVAKKTVSKDGSAHAFGKTYQNGDVLTVGKRQYRILIEITDNKNHSGKIEGPGLVRLRLSGSSNEEQRKRACQHLLSNFVVEIEGDTATARTELHNPIFTGEGRHRQLVHAHGHYLDQLVRTAEGWRIRHRVLTALSGLDPQTAE